MTGHSAVEEDLDVRLALGGAGHLCDGPGLGQQRVQGLAAARERAVVYRDLKPENVLFGRSALLKLLAFGIAKLIERSRKGARRFANHL